MTRGHVAPMYRQEGGPYIAGAVAILADIGHLDIGRAKPAVARIARSTRHPHTPSDEGRRPRPAGYRAGWSRAELYTLFSGSMYRPFQAIRFRLALLDLRPPFPLKASKWFPAVFPIGKFSAVWTSPEADFPVREFSLAARPAAA